MAQRPEHFDHVRGLSPLARNVDDGNKSAIKPKTGHARTVREDIPLRFARIKVQG